MPAQSGSTSMLARMRRGYSRDAYDALVDRIRGSVPGVSFSTDIIVGEPSIATTGSTGFHDHDIRLGRHDCAHAAAQLDRHTVAGLGDYPLAVHPADVGGSRVLLPP